MNLSPLKSNRLKQAVLLLLTLCILITCNKPETNGQNKYNIDLDTEGYPSTVASVNNHLDAEKQYQRLAIGISVVSNRNQTVNKISFLSSLEGLIDANAPNEVTLVELDQAFISNQIAFNEPNANSDFYESVASKISNYNPTNSIPTWYNDFFFGWQLSSSIPGSSPIFYKTTIDIPEKEYQIQNNHQSKNILIIPDIGIFPTTGYSYDNVTNTLIELNISDETIVEDLMELHDYYIISLSYELVVDNEKITHNCDPLEGKSVAWDQFDFFCDEKCGESAANSPFDCSVANSKTVYLRRVGFTNDHKNKQSSCIEKKHHYKSALGKYKVAFMSTILQANKKVETREKITLNPILLKDVLRKRTKANGTTAQRGTSLWLEAKLKKSSEEPIVAENYCPSRSIIYIGFYEKNSLISPDSVIVMEGATKLAKWMVRGISISSVKGGTNCAFGDDVYYKRIPFNDPKWVPGTIGGENVMIYNTNQIGDDEFNFEIYYFVNKKSK